VEDEVPHRGDDALHRDELHNRGQDLIDLYAEIGYECLIIWEDELDSAIEKIAAFIDLSEWQLSLTL